MDGVGLGKKEVGVTSATVIVFAVFLAGFSARVPEHNHCNCFK